MTLIPNEPSSSLAITLTCFIRLVVLILALTDVLKTVPINLTFADAPRIVLSVIVTVELPVPLIVLVTSTKSP